VFSALGFLTAHCLALAVSRCPALTWRPPGCSFGGRPAGFGVPSCPANTAVTELGSLSAIASISEICHIWVSKRLRLKPGIPVSRIPFAIFQNVSPGRSSVTPFPLNNSGGMGNSPRAIGVCFFPRMPWHTVQSIKRFFVSSY